LEQLPAQWKRYLEERTINEPLRAGSLASCQRSQEAGVEPQPQDVPFRRVAEDDLLQRLAVGAELIAVALPHLEWATVFLNSVSHVVFLTDRDGIVLRSWGDRSLIDNFGMGPGFDWSERAMGTNGAGTALVTNEPLAVVGPEHFTHSIHGCTYTAVPIHGLGGEVIGAINISTSVADGSPERVLLAAHIAFVIDRELALKEQVRRGQAGHLSSQVAGFVESSRDAVTGMTVEDQLRQRTAELQESEQQFRLMVEGTTDSAMFLLDAAGFVRSWNSGAERIKGYRTDEILGQHCSRFYPEEDVRAGKPEEELRVAEAEGRSEVEGWRVCEDGSRYWAKVTTTALLDATGTLRGFSKFSHDLTERRQSEERLRLVVDAAPTGMVMIDQGGVICLVNAQVGEAFGYLPGELIGTSVEVLVPERFRDRHIIDRTTFSAAPNSRHMGRGGELFGRRKDGSEFPVEIGLQPISLDEGAFVLASVIDISERKRAEKKLRASEEMARSILNAITAHIAVLDSKGTILAVNSAWERFALANGEASLARSGVGVNYLDVCRHAVQEKDALAGQVLDGLKRILDGSLPEFGIEYPCHSSSEERWFLLHATPLPGSQAGAVVSHTSVTELKQTEAALRESVRIYRAIGESIDYGVWVCDPEGKNTYASPSFLHLVGLTQQQCAEFGWGKVLHPDDAERTIAAWQECVRVGGKWDIEHRFQGVDGHWHPILARGVPVKDDQGRLVGWAGINLDISRQKEAESALRQAHDQLEQRVQERTAELMEVNENLRREIEDRRGVEALLREHAEEIETLMDVLPVPVWIARDPECRQITGNRATYELTRLPQGANVSKSAPPEERPNFRVFRRKKELAPEDLPMQQAAATGAQVNNAELDLLFDDGSLRSILGFAAPLFDAEHQVRGCIGAFIDITERRQLENNLRESEERYRSVVDSLAEGIVFHDADGSIIASNDRASVILGLTRDQIAGKTSLDPMWESVRADGSPFPGDEHPAMMVLRTGQPVFNAIMGVRKPSGDQTWMTVNAVPVSHSAGKPKGVVASFHDITESRQLHETVRASLREKEILLQEIHHRVKNNLQVISSLLYLQSQRTSDMASVELFRESQHRVRSMALVHERLYSSQEFSRVDFKEYIESLATYLFRSYHTSTDRISLEADVQGVRLPIDAAVPCGLLVNELISNCLKHAFHGRDVGRIRVELVPLTAAEALLCVSDDGVGLPLSVNPEAAVTFGMQLIVALVDQLHGRLTVGRQGGTAVRVIFPLEEQPAVKRVDL
jgi:PAS domain S-box-containing protein